MSMNSARNALSIVHIFPADEIVDPVLFGKIATECWEGFMDIEEKCLKVSSCK